MDGSDRPKLDSYFGRHTEHSSGGRNDLEAKAWSHPIFVANGGGDGNPHTATTMLRDDSLRGVAYRQRSIVKLGIPVPWIRRPPPVQLWLYLKA